VLTDKQTNTQIDTTENIILPSLQCTTLISRRSDDSIAPPAWRQVRNYRLYIIPGTIYVSFLSAYLYGLLTLVSSVE